MTLSTITATAGCTTAKVKIAALPKDPNPYQELLYEPIRAAGTPVTYVGEVTRSRTLNQLLLPVELAFLRLRGFDILHVHWLFGFRLAGSARWPVMLKVSRLWFGLVMLVARTLGYRVVWTAHNVLPHSAIFDDDVAARRLLVRSCHLVIVHASNALAGLKTLGLTPRSSVVIPPGSYDLPQFAALGVPPPRRPITLLCFGQVAEYKGIEDLLREVPRVKSDVHVMVVGNCPSPGLRQRLEELAARAPSRISLLLRFASEEELAGRFERAHAVILPYREVTTSSSVLLAMASGRPVVVPDLPAFTDLPDGAVIRYPAGQEGLRRALEGLNDMSLDELATIGRVGRSVALGISWDEIGRRTVSAFEGLL